MPDWHEGWFATAEAFFAQKCASAGAVKALQARQQPKWMRAQLLGLHRQAPGWVRFDDVLSVGRLWAVHQLPCEQPAWPQSVVRVAARLGMPESWYDRFVTNPNLDVVGAEARRVLAAAAAEEVTVCLARLGNELQSLRSSRIGASGRSPAAAVRARWERDWLREQQWQAER